MSEASTFSTASIGSRSINYSSESHFGYNNTSNSIAQVPSAGSKVQGVVFFDHEVVYRGVHHVALGASGVTIGAWAHAGGQSVPGNFWIHTSGSETYKSEATEADFPVSGLYHAIIVNAGTVVSGEGAWPFGEAAFGRASAYEWGSIEWDENTVYTQDETFATPPAECRAAVNFPVRTYLGGAPNATVVFDPPSGSFEPGHHPVVCRVNYAWGPTKVLQFDAKVNATPGPCPKDIMVVTANGGTAMVTLKHPDICATGSDIRRNRWVLDTNNNAVIESLYGPAPAIEQVALPPGTYTVGVSGGRSDDCGSYSCSFQVTVLPSYALPEDRPGDTDGDGIPDWLELLAHTNPLDAEDRFEMRMTTEPAGMRLAWEGRAGVAYQVEEGGLDAEGWSPAGPVISPNTDGPQSLLVPTTGHSRRFFKLSVVNQP